MRALGGKARAPRRAIVAPGWRQPPARWLADPTAIGRHSRPARLPDRRGGAARDDPGGLGFLVELEIAQGRPADRDRGQDRPLSDAAFGDPVLAPPSSTPGPPRPGRYPSRRQPLPARETPRCPRPRPGRQPAFRRRRQAQDPRGSAFGVATKGGQFRMSLGHQRRPRLAGAGSEEKRATVNMGGDRSSDALFLGVGPRAE